MSWSKVMSVTDAQQPTSGRIVPYMRFTKSNNIQDNQTWFRNTFFANQNWFNTTFGDHAVERCDVDIEVSIAGSYKGIRKMFITHDPTRMANNSTPNTWIHYDAATVADLQTVDTTGMTFNIDAKGNGYQLDIA